MYPSATYGYMPFVKPTHKRQAAKKPKCEKPKSKHSVPASTDTKRYKVTLRDRNGYSYTYIIQADTTSSGSMPTLLGQTVSAPRHIKSMPNMNMSPSSSPETQRRAMLAQGKEDLSKVDEGEKKGLFNSLINFIKKRTGSRKASVPVPVKSKRKTKPVFPKKRQRTISAVSNLETIHESPVEGDDYETIDTDSYTHDSSDSNSDIEGSAS